MSTYIESRVIRFICIPYSNFIYDNRKAGLKLYDEHIRNARDLKAKQSMIGWMLVKYKIMIKCFENPKFPIDKIKLDKEIVEMEMKLKNIL